MLTDIGLIAGIGLSAYFTLGAVLRALGRVAGKWWPASPWSGWLFALGVTLQWLPALILLSRYDWAAQAMQTTGMLTVLGGLYLDRRARQAHSAKNARS